MVDSRQIEKTGIKNENSPVPVVVRESFDFFNKPVPLPDNSIIQTADIKYAQNETFSGALVGYAKTLDGKKLKGNDQLRIIFEIRTTIAQGQTHDTLTGQPLEKPMILMETPYGVFASRGNEAVNGTERIITYNQWVKIQKRTDATKHAIETDFKKFAAQPRSLPLSDLHKTKFKII